MMKVANGGFVEIRGDCPKGRKWPRAVRASPASLLLNPLDQLHGNLSPDCVLDVVFFEIFLILPLPFRARRFTSLLLCRALVTVRAGDLDRFPPGAGAQGVAVA